MPSGPKKRKAAKKKKELEGAHNQNHDQQPHSDVSHTDENDDLKHPDDKESDGEELSSPSSQDQPNQQHQFTDGEKEGAEKTDDISHAQLLSEENKSAKGTEENGGAAEKTVSEESVVQTEGESNPVGELNINNRIVEPVDSQCEIGDGILTQSMNVENLVQIEREIKPFEKLDCENATVQDFEYEKGSNEGGLSQGDNGEYHVVDKINVVVDNYQFASSTEAANLLSEGLNQVPNLVPVGKLYGSVVESGSDTVIDNVGSVGEKINTDSCPLGDNSTTSDVVIQGIQENGEKEACALDQKDTSSHFLVDLGLKNKKGEANAATNDSLGVPYAENSATQEINDTLNLSDTAPRDEAAKCGNASNGADDVKYLEVHESSDNQPLLTSATPTVQRTSLMSCCGLFEVLAGSNR